MFEPEKLPAPDEYGLFFHPDIPGKDEGDDIRALCRDLGFDVGVLSMEYDAPALVDECMESEDMAAATRWKPTPPDGDGWMLVAKYDTEDGPYAMFVRPAVEPQPAQEE